MYSFNYESQANYRIPNQLIDLQLQTAPTQMSSQSDNPRVLLPAPNKCYPFFGMNQEPQQCEREVQQLFMDIIQLQQQNEFDLSMLNAFSNKFNFKINNIGRRIITKKLYLYQEVLHCGKIMFSQQEQSFININDVRKTYSLNNKPSNNLMHTIRKDLGSFMMMNKQIIKIKQTMHQFEILQINIQKGIREIQQKYYYLYFKYIRQNNQFKQCFNENNSKGQIQEYYQSKFFSQNIFTKQSMLYDLLKVSTKSQEQCIKQAQKSKNMIQFRKKLPKSLKLVRRQFQNYQQDYFARKQILMSEAVEIIGKYRKCQQQNKQFQAKLIQQSQDGDKKDYYQKGIEINQKIIHRKYEKIITLFKNTYINFNNYICGIRQISQFQKFIKQSIVIQNYICPWHRYLLKVADFDDMVLNQQKIRECLDKLLELLKEKQLPKQIMDSSKLWPLINQKQYKPRRELIFTAAGFDSQQVAIENSRPNIQQIQEQDLKEKHNPQKGGKRVPKRKRFIRAYANIQHFNEQSLFERSQNRNSILDLDIPQSSGSQNIE